jgi:hypothetical protein
VLSEAEVEAIIADDGYAVEADLATVATTGDYFDLKNLPSASAGTVVYTRCAWTAKNASSSSSCAPPSCPGGWTDLGITGRVKTDTESWGGFATNDAYSESSGYDERGCFIATAHTILVTRCAWTGIHGESVSSCSPFACPDGWSDLGVTGNVKTGMALYGALASSSLYARSSGYQERTCLF